MRIKIKPNLNILLLLLLISLSNILSAQKKDSIVVKTSRFGGAVTIQSKGISTIPNLTLGKPAIVFDMVVGRKLTFEPQFRYSLEGKPWAIVFWWRYKILTDKKFTLNASANTSLSFKSGNDITTDPSREIIRTTRYLAAALLPNYQFNKYLGLGTYLFYTRGIETYITQNTYMLSLRPSISNIPITKNIKARIGTEIYYLKMDNKDGVYLNATLLINKKNFPLSITGLVNKPIKSNIPAPYDLLWNVCLVYTFNNEYRHVH
jgi:hypothetical protein